MVLTPPQTRVGMPLDEFLELGSRERFELINGERIPKLSHLFGHDDLVRMLFLLLHTYSIERQWGTAYSETTYALADPDDPNWVTGLRIPDVMFFSGNRIDIYKAEHSDHRQRPLGLVPDFVIEIISPNDKVDELDQKIDSYLTDGVRLIWVLNPQRRKAVVHRPDAQPLHLSGNAVLDGGDVIPGFQVMLSKLFE